MARTSAWTRLSRQFKDEGSKSNAPCWLCGGAIDYTDTRGAMGHATDHAIPVSLYPEHELDPANLRHAHNTCNSSRGNNTPAVKVTRKLQW